MQSSYHLKIIPNRGLNHVFSCHQIIGQIEGSVNTQVLTPEDTDGRKVAGNEGRRESDYESLSELNCALFMSNFAIFAITNCDGGIVFD